MSYSKLFATFFTVGLCTFALSVDAGAQGRGGGGHGGSGGGGRAPSAGHPGPQGVAAPRTTAPPNGRYNGARGGAPNGNYYANGRYYGNGRYPYYGYGRYPYYGYGRYPYYGYGRYPYYGYGYPYYPGFSFSFGWGYPYYGYPYYSYPAYAPYGGYGYVAPGGAAYGGIKIQGAPRNAEVYVDGSYAGVVDNYDGAFQSLDLEPGSHVVEIRAGGQPLTYDVNVTAGHTVTIHATLH